MNIEIVEFYQTERDDEKQILKGTLHVNLIDYGIDLRGVLLSKRKNFWFVGLPCKISIDAETGEKVKYPIISFTDHEKTKKLIADIKEYAKEYVKKHLCV